LCFAVSIIDLTETDIGKDDDDDDDDDDDLVFSLIYHPV
jgi:hypothetical protein